MLLVPGFLLLLLQLFLLEVEVWLGRDSLLVGLIDRLARVYVCV